MTEGYVTFVDSNPTYLELTNILVESVLNFSTRPIEVFTINSDYNHSSSRVINRRIDVKNVDYATICYSKLFSSFNSNFNYGIQLDADFIITKDMDKLFEDTKTIVDTPLGSLHPSDPNNQQSVMSYLGVTEKSQPYVHATYLFSDGCKPFLEECYNLSQTFYSNGWNPPNFDETIYNSMLWKYGSKKWVDCYDPYFDFFLNHNHKEMHGYGWMENINFYSCHGIKDPNFARSVLDDLINKSL
jgi:hypothetical protein